MERMNMSARAYDRILKVARTIADLEACADVLDHHIMEAIAYRNSTAPPTWATICKSWFSYLFSVKKLKKHSFN